MKTSTHCIPCFRKQAQYTAALATGSKQVQAAIIERSYQLIDSFNHELSPPENAVPLYRMIAEMAENGDIFADLKKESNLKAGAMAESLTDIINRSEKPVQTAAKLSIAGNIIDYGSQQEFDIEKTIQKALVTDMAVDHLETFISDIKKAQNILYLGDNCGETVFDRLFITATEKSVTYAVKENPVINDAVIDDAMACELHKVCTIISNGTDCPGTPLDRCSGEFRQVWEKADLIISKGQGNFETLSDIRAPIYFLLMVKCPVVAGHINSSFITDPEKKVKTGDMIIMRHQLFT